MSFARLTAAVSVLALVSAAQAQDLPLAPLENYGKVVITARQSAGAITFEQAFGGEFDAEPASDYPESSELRRLGRAVGRLDVAFARGVGYCTGFLISDQYLMTNAHCLEGGQVQSISFITGYVESGIEEGTRVYNVGTSPVEISPSNELDYAILQVFGNPAADWGTLKLAALEIDEGRDAGMPLMVLGHPVFQVAPVPVPQALYVSRKECRATDSKPLAGKQLRHTCDTLQGNSGSPVFSDDTRQVIALHHAGSPREGINFAIPMTLIAQNSKVVAELLALAPAPDEGSAALAAQLAAAQAELEQLRQQTAEAEAERQRLAEEAQKLAGPRLGEAADPGPVSGEAAQNTDLETVLRALEDAKRNGNAEVAAQLERIAARLRAEPGMQRASQTDMSDPETPPGEIAADPVPPDPDDLLARLDTTTSEKTVSRREILRRSQAQLNALGCDAGTPDGIIGPRTREAFRRFLAATDGTVDADDLGTVTALEALEARSGTICKQVAVAPGTAPPDAPRPEALAEAAPPSYSMVGSWSWTATCPLGQATGTTVYRSAGGSAFSGTISGSSGPGTTRGTLNGRTYSATETFGWVTNTANGTLSADGRSLRLSVSNGCTVAVRKN